MRIGMVGGVTRNDNAFRALAATYGHDLLLHSGHVGGRGTETLTELARSVDYLIIVTDVNSHGGVILARRAAARFGTPVALFRRLGPSRLNEILTHVESVPEFRRVAQAA